MPTERSQEYLCSVVDELRKLPKETEWVEFKQNRAAPEEIGEYISALSNAAASSGKPSAYMIWGIHDASHEIVGTSFSPSATKIGNEELENWVLRLLSPKILFKFHEFTIAEHPVVLLEISRATRHPVQFKHREFIRIGSYKKLLKDFPERERELWRIFDNILFEDHVALEDLKDTDVLNLLDYPAYFDLLKLPLPENRHGILDAFQADGMITRSASGRWNVLNLGAILFAKHLPDVKRLRRKTVRVIVYRGTNRVNTLREQEVVKGYAQGFQGLIGFINTLLPENEIIGKALREKVTMYPEIAIRELVANAMIHQDFDLTGSGPMVEIFDNRMEITNPGKPLVDTARFLDSPPRSRNESLAAFMRRIGVCEERGSGIDKVVLATEAFQLPAPMFEVFEEHTRSILFSHKELRDMESDERIRACYLHACLKYVSRDAMTNSSLRERFGIANKNSAMASRIIRETVEAELIVPYDRSAAKKMMKYVPFWAKAGQQNGI